MINSLCISCFVSGEKYAHYIPFFIHSVIKSYPEYYTVISYKQDKLPDVVENQLKMLDQTKFKVRKGQAEFYPDDPDVCKTLRWVMTPPEFELYENIYITDIDMLILRENTNLLDKKLKLCEEDNNLCYSNSIAVDDWVTRGKRMTGIHFFKSKKYLKKMYPIMEKYKEILREGMPKHFYNAALGKNDNQMALRIMIEEAGLPMPGNLTFEYNGLHVGHSRVKGRWDDLFKYDHCHKAYLNTFKNIVYDDIFKKMLNETYKETGDEINDMLLSGGVN